MSDVLTPKSAYETSLTLGEDFSINGLFQTEMPFRPVKCKESQLEKITPVNGYLYFATDVQKIYYGDNGEFKSMGGNSGIYYAHKAFEDSSDTAFDITDFDDETLPNINDLIINVSTNTERDGFYKVIEIESDTRVITSYLPVGGGGSGGGPGGGGGTVGTVAIGYVSPQIDSTITGVDYWIEYTLDARDSNGDPVINSGKATWRVNGKKIDGGIVVNGPNKFNIGPYLDASRDTNTISLQVSINTGGIVDSQGTKQWQITAVDLSLDWDWEYGEQSVITDSTFTLFWTPYGNVDCVTHFLFDNDWENGYFTQDIAARQTGRVNSKDFITNDFGYGAHKVEMWVTANINGADYKTESIINELTIVIGGTTPILTVPFYETHATQYDTIQIPFTIYDPRDTEPEVQFLVNDNVVSTDNYDRTLHHWTYTLGVSGSIKLELRSGVTSRSFELSVVPLALDVEEVSGRKFALKASDFSGNDGIRNWSENGVTLGFQNFDWKNGGLKTELDENGYLRKYILVKNGSRMIINYNLFGNEAQRNGKNFKIIFKATRCYNYDASILECFDTINEETGDGIGIKLKAQNATFNSANISMTTQYCEDSYIELETEIWKGSSTAENPDNFVMFWVDGVPAQVQVYDYNDIFRQPSTNRENGSVPIIIGSDDCDVQVYLVKVYEKQLNEDEHLDNFIIDAPNTEEMLARYNRNNILDNAGEISYSKLIEKNPNCRVHTYRMDRMTMNKKDKITGCDYAQYHSDPITPDLTASNVTVKVQGTSSAAYGVAAFNIDSEFTEGFTDKDGNHLDGWSMSDTAIPVDYFCTKVNVASCENTNNAINQEWYNEFQPYWDAHRRKTYAADPTKKYRDTMEFTMGVMFIQDENPVKTFTSHDDYPAANMFCDTKGYVENPYYKQYSICNMGNSKDNITVFHDNDNPKACCVEVCDNQNAEHWMTTHVDMTAYDELESRDPFYEFRYPDGNDEATTEQKQAFLDFVNWMCDCNPAAATGEDLPSSETYGEYKFKGFDPPGFEGKANPTGISLKGYTEKTYAGTYTKDTYERRMAKMLAECEDHLVMDSVLFHYLFIERHTMVDNVAKNTFWSSEDLIHWDLTKDYDNDTADGNNNTGYLVYTYGLECLDMESDTKYVFNAKDSVWLQFCHGLKGAQVQLYQALSSYKGASGKFVGAWDELAYLKKHKDWQSYIPERCWIYDYFRKYIRPRRLGLDNDVYLKRLEGGKKTHQRNQYETYQRYYLDSKYMTGKAVNAKIDLRANNSDLGDLVTPLTTYIDCYAYAVIGGQTYHERIKRGQICNLPVSELITSGNDSTCYYYCASMIQSIANLQYLYTQYATLTSADKLLFLELGSDDEGYRNNNMTTADFGSNTMLQKAYVQNCGNPDGDPMNVLDLTKLTSLEELRINGSTYAGVNLPDGGILETAYINAVSQLRMKDLEKLETLVFDEGIYDKLNNIYISNCPIVDTYDLISKSNILKYYLDGINWEITDNSLENGALVKIDVLDKLLEKATPETSDTRTSLTGNIVINLGDKAYTVDEFAIYNKYNRKFPNLKITYQGNVTVTPAIKITFMESDSLESDVLFEVLTDGSYKMEDLVAETGPAGAAIDIPVKDQTIYHTFSWNLTADDLDWRKSTEQESAGITHEALLASTPTENVIYLPIFTPVERLYNVTFRDWDGADITEDLGIQKQVPYNTVINSNNAKLKYIYREPRNAESRYDFQGWISPEDYLSATKTPTFITDFTILEDFIVYAFYVEKKITEPNDLKLFNVTNAGAISLKSDFKDLYKGSITLPAKTNNKFITEVANGGFSECVELTEVYYEEGNQYSIIRDKAFFECPKLEKTYLPQTLIELGDNVFEHCFNLTTISNNNELPTSLTSIGSHCFRGDIRQSMKVKIEELPADLEYIGAQAFYYCPNLSMTVIPKNITRIESWTFAGCPKVRVSVFGNNGLDEAGDNNLVRIEGGAFYNAGEGVTEVIIKSSVKQASLVNNQFAPFTNYGVGYIMHTTLNASIIFDDGTPVVGAADLGLPETDSVDSGIPEEV